MKRTQWFPPDVKPVHEGVYERHFILANGRESCAYSLWDGRIWCVDVVHVSRAMQYEHVRSSAQNRPWRGLTRPAA